MKLNFPNRGRAVLIAAQLAVMIGLCGVGPARANLLTNGSFETGTAPGEAMALPPGSTAITGWTVTRSGIDYVEARWTAASGFRSVGLNGPDAGGISQTIATLPNAEYTVRFYLAGDSGTLPVIKNMAVTAAGQSHNFTADITGMWAWDPGWNPNMWSFHANSLNTTIEFFSTMPGDTAGATLDSVTVELNSTVGVADPAPGALSLAMLSPNPARGASVLAFTLPGRASARLSVFDPAGREVAVLADGEFAAGRHEARWDAFAGGASAPPGLYLVALRTAERRLVRRLLLVR